MKTLNRRTFVKTAGVSSAGVAACAGLAAPAIAQSSPVLKWRLTSSFPKSLDTIYGAGEVFAKALAEATDQKFLVQVFPAGEIVGGLKAADEVTKGTVEMAHTASYYYWGKDPTFAFGTAVPFGLNARMQNAWTEVGGGNELLNEFYKAYNIYAIPAGNTGAQMGGWYRKEIKTPADYKSLKMRIGGFGGKIISKLGAVPQQIPGDQIYQALDKGTIDATEWVGPYDDQKLGFYKVAKYYYYPGWWEGGAMLHLFINLDKWNQLPKHYQAAVRNAAALANTTMLARYDAQNPEALKILLSKGTQLRQFSQPVLDACFQAAEEVYADISSKNKSFEKLYQSIKAFRADAYFWQQISEYRYDRFMMIQERKRKL